ncbi:MAG: hypothetical protein [Caudoviricetes sp.]|nr:MAG: hypothetical protein [Caudoviricetes sp.]
MATISGTLRLNDAFSNVLNRFNSGIQRSVAASNRLKSSLNSGSNGMTALSNNANKANVGLRQIIAGSAFGSMISNAASAATNGMRAFVGELNESTVAWSTFEGNMRQMGKSPAEINAAKKSLQKFAQDTIYSSSDMASTYSQLAAVGTKNTTQLVKGFGGLAAAATDPKQAMKTLSQQATQMAAKPTVQWQDFKLMLEQTPAGMAAVAKSMGMSTRQLVKQVQDGTIKTNQFLNAIAKTGTNANFSKMATQYKTVGQALDGLKETLANKVQPQFKKLSDIIIKEISKFTDKLGKVNFRKFADKLIDDINRVKKGISSFAKGFASEFGMTQFKQTAHDISESFNTLFEGLNKNTGKNPLADMGKGVGRFALQMANGLSNLATAISQMDPSAIKALAAAFVALKFGVNGVKLVAIAAGLKIISRLDPGQLQHLATAITTLATAFVAFKVASAAVNTVSGMAGFFNGIKSGIASVINLVTVTLPAAFSGIGDVIAVALGPVGWVIAGITVLIGGAVNAWQNNLFNFRDNIQNLFSNLGEVLEPLKAAFSGLGEALEPASGALSVFGNIIAGFSVEAINNIALSLARLADKVRHLISVLTAGVYVIRTIIDALGTVGNAAKDVFSGNWSFSNTKNAAKSVTKDIEGISEALSHLGDNTVTDKTIAALQGIDLQAKKTKTSVDSIKMPGVIDNNKTIANMNNVSAQKAKLKNAKSTLPISYAADPASLAKIQNQLNSKTSKAKVNQKISYSGKNWLNQIKQNQAKVKVKVDTSAAATAKKKIQSQIGSKPIKVKVAKPKIPTPKRPKIKTLHAKVARPKVPTPKSPRVKTIHVKVARPRVPQPIMPKLKTIPGPRMGRAKTGAFLASVHSAINQAAAIARSGVGPMYSAGAMIGQGLAAGMQSEVGAVAAAANALVAQADRAARAKAKIHSPSRLFAEIGGFIGQGMALGMNNTQGIVASASDAMIATATPDVPGIDYNANVGSPGQSGGLTNARFGGNNTSNDNHSSTVTIESGAIQINSSGNNDEDFETLVGKFEDYLIAKSEKSLS